jgi:hypothetical protein
MVIQWCYNGVTIVLQWCCSGVAMAFITLAGGASPLVWSISVTFHFNLISCLIIIRKKDKGKMRNSLFSGQQIQIDVANLVMVMVMMLQGDGYGVTE